MVAGEPDPAAGQHMLGLFVPHLSCGHAVEPEQAQAIGRSQVGGAQYRDGTAEQRRGRRVTGGCPGGEAVQQQVGR